MGPRAADITALPRAGRGVRADGATLSSVTCGYDDPASDHPAPEDPAPGGVSGAGLGTAMDRHPSGLGQRLDLYLAAVARELQAQGVLTGSPQRSDPAQRLMGSIVLDCTALQVTAAAPAEDPSDDQQPAGSAQSLGGALYPARPAPVVVTWDEDTGWCAGLHHDPTSSSRRYLLPDLLPPPTAVAEFVIGLALGKPLGAAHPVDTPAPGERPLRLVR